MKKELSYIGLLAKLNLKLCLAIFFMMSIAEVALFKYLLTTHNTDYSYSVFESIVNTSLFLSIFSFALILISVILATSLTWQTSPQPTYSIKRLGLSVNRQLILRLLYNIAIISTLWAVQTTLIIIMFWVYQSGADNLSIVSLNFSRVIYHNAFFNHFIPMSNYFIIINNITFIIVLSFILANYQLNTLYKTYFISLVLILFSGILSLNKNLAHTLMHIFDIIVYIFTLTGICYLMFKEQENES